MDGLKCVIPYSCKEEQEVEEITLFEFFCNEELKKTR